jgi:hypothetical protein
MRCRNLETQPSFGPSSSGLSSFRYMDHPMGGTNGGHVAFALPLLYTQAFGNHRLIYGGKQPLGTRLHHL